MTFPTTVWVVMQVDAEGRPRGFHKSLPLLYYEEERAKAEKKGREQERNSTKYTVQKCVIMGCDEYERLVGPATLPGEL